MALFKKTLLQPLKIATIMSSAIIISACIGGSGGGDPEPLEPTIFEIASDDDRFDILTLALETTDLDMPLNDPNETFTVFAPTDEAFEALGELLQQTPEQLLARDDLADILRYHVIADQEVDSTLAISLASGGAVQPTLNGKSFALTLSDNNLFVNQAQVIDPDISAENGIIHVLDAVILPPSPIDFDGTIAEAVIANDGTGDNDLGTLLAAVQAADPSVLEALSDPNAKLTVFAPLNSAFAAFAENNDINALLANTPKLTDVLTYHVFADAAVDSITAISLSGNSVEMFNGDEVNISFIDGKLFINNAEVVTKDIVTDNGTIHLIDTVLLPPLGNLIEVATADPEGRFTKLAELLVATELDEVLKNAEGQFTVFAPTNEAFAALEAALGAGVLDGLLMSNPDAVKDILLYHVIGGAVINSEAALGANEATFATARGDGREFTVNVDQSGESPVVLINQSRLIDFDIMADNGIIHVTDSVIVPPGTIADVAIAAGIFDSVPQALINAGVNPALVEGLNTQALFEQTGLADVLGDTEQQFTVFVPTAEAFAALDDATLQAVASDIMLLADVLEYHVTSAGAFTKAQALEAAEANTSIPMLDQNSVTLSKNGDGNLLINNANVVQANVQASNGIIHFIDAVLQP